MTTLTRCCALVLLLLTPAAHAERTQPDDAARSRHAGPIISFDHPEGWEISSDEDEEESNQARSWLVEAEPPEFDAQATVNVYSKSGSAEEELATALENFSDWLEVTPRGGKRVSKLGAWEGVGRWYTFELEDERYVVEILVVELTEWFNADLRLVYRAEDEPEVMPGFEMILGTLKFSTPDRAMPDVANGYYVSSGAFKALLPGNWTWEESAEGSADPADLVRRLDIYPHADGVLRLMEFSWDGTAEEAVESTIEYRLGAGEELARAPLKSWGPFEGEGVVIRYRAAHGTEYRMRVVVEEVGEGVFREVQLISADGAAEVIDPGYMFIEKTLEIE